MKWGKGYLSIRRLADNEDVAFYFTYLNYAPQIQSMIYTTNWIERLQKDFRRVTRMRGAMPDENSVIVLMVKTAMEKESYPRDTIKLSANNLLDQKAYSYTVFNGLNIHSYDFALRPREVVLSIQFTM